MVNGTVALKMRYLGDAFAGQDLCYSKISVGQNAVSVVTVKAGRVVSSKFVDQADAVVLLKNKLRAYITRQGSPKRWRVVKTRYGAEIVIYYPSVSWGGRTGTVQWMASGAI